MIIDQRRRDMPLLIARGALLALGLLFPVHLPYAIAASTDAEKLLGWWASPGGAADEQRPVVIRTVWQATNSGLLPGDAIIELNREPATMDRLFAMRAEARPGDTLQLRISRRGTEHQLHVPVTGSSPSYAGYRWYRLALATVAWLIGMGIVAWRGGSAEGLLLGGALMLLGPVTLPVAIADARSGLLAANFIWHLAGGVYRFLLPILVVLVLLRRSSRRELVRSGYVTFALCAGALVVAALISSGFTRPLDWAAPGFQKEVRSVSGLTAELVALAGLFAVTRELRASAAPVRWLAFAVGLFLGAGAVLSSAMLAFEQWPDMIDALRHVKALTLALLPVTALLYMTLREDEGPLEDWKAREHASAFISVFLAALYGFAVAGSGAIALSVLGISLNGAELPLFVTIFVATIVFSPVLRWARDMVDRRVFSRWVAVEQKAHELAHDLNGDLEPGRIAQRLRLSLPHILDVTAVDLVVATELADGWKAPVEPNVPHVPREALQRLLEGGVTVDRKLLEPVRRPSGELIGAIQYRLPRDHLTLAAPERIAMNAVAEGVAVALRNTESYFQLRKVNQELAENERVASLGVMAGALAHEIKNPLASLKMGLYLLQRRTPDPSRLQRIEGDVRRIDDLVSSMLRFTANAQREPREPIDLSAALDATVADLESLARDRDVHLERSVPARSAIILGGTSGVRVLLSSILRNSLDACDAGGRVAVRLDHGTDEVTVEIADDGHGIPPGLQRRVFDLNFSTKPEGSGLGLALARREAERLGGRIELESGDGRGTTLRVVLPAAREPAERSTT